MHAGRVPAQVRQAELPLRATRRPRPPRVGADAQVRRQAREPGDSQGRAGADAGADRRAPSLPGVVAAPGGGQRGIVQSPACGGTGRGAERPKKGLRGSLTESFAADLAAEIDALAGPGAADGIDFEVLGSAVRRQALGLAARLVERRLNADCRDRAGATLPCGCWRPLRREVTPLGRASRLTMRERKHRLPESRRLRTPCARFRRSARPPCPGASRRKRYFRSRNASLRQ